MSCGYFSFFFLYKNELLDELRVYAAFDLMQQRSLFYTSLGNLIKQLAKGVLEVRIENQWLQGSIRMTMRKRGNRSLWFSISWLRAAFPYSHLEDEDELEEIPAQKLSTLFGKLKRQRRQLWVWRGLTLLLAMGLSIDLIARNNLVRLAGQADVQSSTVHDVHMQCGNNTKSAISRGCQFHLLSNSWLPGRCEVDRSEGVIASALNIDTMEHEQSTFKAWRDPAGESEITDVGNQTAMLDSLWIRC